MTGSADNADAALAGSTDAEGTDVAVPGSAADAGDEESRAEPSPESDDPDPAATAEERSTVDVSSDESLIAALEAMLLVVDSPVPEETLANSVDQPVERVTEMLRTMAEDLRDRSSGIDLRRVAEGWRFYTRDLYAPFVEQLLLDGQRSKLTRAALETLAVIAYRQPVSRARVAAVRGVNVDGVIRSLLARGLIEESGADEETGGTLYVTTELFLERLGLSSLGELPPIAPLLPEVDTVDDF
ncbi:SMC-Scp complex subunit ScpB [Haloechinothrix sp. YIM 98757]|uniref:SMC-Scp complex subunit ScpB n=1 Tax=Haloechinothrix aidingensis TaxID=2752311 RepID=A0A838AGK0_9PSEU|nr:SMC-Scp complex subunit ScpB [Haloechinothrix aidingensis]MBA0128275.1 SMC-Scp complex subunit ScpB [Haloechinothrix aidingensis]